MVRFNSFGQIRKVPFMSMSDLRAAVRRFPDVRVLVVGDIILDRFIYGKIERISPEAPVPVFNVGRETRMLGGAGNVVANIISLGCRCDFLGIVGNDPHGDLLSSLLGEGGAHSHLLRLSDYPTIVKTRLIAGSNHVARIDKEEILPINEELIPRFIKLFERMVNQVDIVLVSDYSKGLLTKITTKLIIDACRNAGKKVVVDPKGPDYSKYCGATLVKPNLKEFSEATKRKYNPKSPTFFDDIREGASSFLRENGIENVMITLSEHGMAHVCAETPEHIETMPTRAKEVFDVSGAGDTALAAIGAGLAAGLGVSEAMELANRASGVVVGKLGTATVSVEELLESLGQKSSRAAEDFLSAADAEKELAACPSSGLYVMTRESLGADGMANLQKMCAECKKVFLAVDAEDRDLLAVASSLNYPCSIVKCKTGEADKLRQLDWSSIIGA